MMEKMKGKVIIVFLVTMLMLSGAFVNGSDVKNSGSRGDTFTSVTIYGSTSDGDIHKMATTYAGARNAASGTIYYTCDNYSLGQQVIHTPGGDLYYVYRSFVYFDTSCIPSDATITSASLALVCWWKDVDDNNFDVVVQKGQSGYPHDPMQEGDYNKDHYSGNGGSMNYDSFVVNAYNSIPLNPDGLGWINKGSGAVTKFCLRSSNDINDEPIQPPDYGIYRDQIAFLSCEADCTPLLILEYTVPNQSPTVDITYPVGGDTVSGTITISGTASDSDGSVTLVEVNIDGGSWWPCSGTTSWSKSWDTTGASTGWHTIYARSKDDDGAYSSIDHVTVDVENGGGNQPPTTPVISGPSSGFVNVEYTFTASSTDPDGDQVYYWFDWDDGTNSGWVGPYASGETASAKHTWATKGTYEIKVKAKDEHGSESLEGSKTITISDGGSTSSYWALILVPFPDDTESYGGIQNEVNKLTDTLCSGGWQSDHIKVLYKCSQWDFKGIKGMGWLKSNVKSGDKVMVWFYTHGHGYSAWIFDYFCFLELRGPITLLQYMDANWLFADRLTYDELDKSLSKLASQDITVVLNACHSGYGVDKLKNDNRVILAACKKEEGGYGYIFAEYLRLGLKGWADLKPFGGNGDGYVSSEEAFKFAFANRAASTTPQIGDYRSDEMPITQLPDHLDQYQREYNNYPDYAQGQQLLAQSFKPASSVLTRISLFIKPSDNSEPLIISIRQGTNEGPSSSDLITREITLEYNEEYYETIIDLGEFHVNPGQTYYIVCKTNSDIAKYMWWGTDDTTYYTRGEAWRSVDNGNHWAKIWDPCDFVFFTFGKN